ncbi:HEPN domain-containing protein [Candidatus Bathyarchaeota archaeon]|nr:HEPN domain-containing protein [Candidatus Bathyarchaeota archaeon]
MPLGSYVYFLHGFRSENLPKIELSENLDLRPINDDDKALLNLPRTISLYDLGMLHSSTHVLEARILDEGNTEKLAHSVVYDAVSALRLFKMAKIGTHYYYSKKDKHPGLIGFFGPLNTTQIWYMTRTYQLEDEEAKSFKIFFTLFRGVKRDNRIEFALRWFNSAYSTMTSTDVLLNYVISLEALYLSGESEKGFRLRTYMTSFLSKNSRARAIEIWTYIKKAYELRGSIVHGNALLPEEIRLEGIGEVSILDFLMKIEFYTRESIRKFIKLKAKDPGLDILETIERSFYDENEKQRLSLG